MTAKNPQKQGKSFRKGGGEKVFLLARIYTPVANVTLPRRNARLLNKAVYDVKAKYKNEISGYIYFI